MIGTRQCFKILRIYDWQLRIQELQFHHSCILSLMWTQLYATCNNCSLHCLKSDAVIKEECIVFASFVTNAVTGQE
jgi:hypothetical protein